MTVSFHDSVDDELLKYVVIIAKYKGRFLYCKHKERSTYEIPGGKRKRFETIEDAARRELYEETGAKKYSLIPVCVYSVKDGEKLTYGMLYVADVEHLGEKPKSEIERIFFLDAHPENQTYPEIQPKLIKEASKRYLI